MIERKSGDGGNRTHAKFLPTNVGRVLATIALFIVFVLAFLGPLFLASAFGKCRTHRCHERVHAKRAEAWVRRERPALWQWRHELPGWRAWVLSTARCESNLRWHIATGNGFYGGLQFTPGTWFAAQALVPSRMRTRQMPHLAPWYLQGVVAIAYAKRYGRGAWPVCG